jgi:hypothetical protein
MGVEGGAVVGVGRCKGGHVDGQRVALVFKENGQIALGDFA